jgi:hypothetical protein
MLGTSTRAIRNVMFAMHNKYQDLLLPFANDKIPLINC